MNYVSISKIVTRKKLYFLASINLELVFFASNLIVWKMRATFLTLCLCFPNLLRRHLCQSFVAFNSGKQKIRKKKDRICKSGLARWGGVIRAVGVWKVVGFLRVISCWSCNSSKWLKFFLDKLLVWFRIVHSL